MDPHYNSDHTFVTNNATTAHKYKDFSVVIEEADPQISNEDCADIMENIVLPHTLIWYADHSRYHSKTTSESMVKLKRGTSFTDEVYLHFYCWYKHVPKWLVEIMKQHFD